MTPVASIGWAALAELEGVASAYAAARDGIDAVLRDRGPRRTAPEVTVESLLLGAHANAALAGSTTTLAEVRAGACDPTAAAAVRLSTEELALAPLLLRSPLQAFARLHTLAAAGSVAAEELGRPSGPDAARQLHGLAERVVGAGSLPGLLVAALAHAELATAEPFGPWSGLLARATERMLLVARGVDEKSLIVPEAGHLALRPAYESNLAAYRDGGVVGQHAWLLYAAEAFAAGAEASPVRAHS